MLRISVLLMILPLGGCYYMQAAAGQWEVLRKRDPVEHVIADVETPPEVRQKLALLRDARDFSITQLGLPDNDSYRSYADLERDYVLWNVFAVRELAFEAKRWCFPVAGCVSYRGHFVRARAEREAERLRADGYDVVVGGVAAYSTLGRFDDPILSTMLGWSEARIVATLFHELAHQVLYVQDDTAFNESFATAVEEFGVERWLRQRGDPDAFDRYLERREYSESQMGLIRAARSDLQQVYAGDAPDAEKRRRKAKRLRELVDALDALARESGFRRSGWFSGELNNAHLLPATLYEGRLHFFRRLFDNCAQDFQCFYDVARERARRDEDERYQWP